MLSDVPSDIRGVVRYCDKSYILVLPVGSRMVEYCQGIAMLWVRVFYYEGYFGTITIVPCYLL